MKPPTNNFTPASILAVDTSCDESCAALFDVTGWKMLGDIVHSHVNAMQRFGGVVPEVASREHLRGLPLAVTELLSSTKKELKEVDWFAVTHRPGLVGALLVGVSFTKALAFTLGKPFTAFNHVEAHLFFSSFSRHRREGDARVSVVGFGGQWRPHRAFG